MFHRRQGFLFLFTQDGQAADQTLTVQITMNRDLAFQLFLGPSVKGRVGGAHVGKFRAAAAIGDLIHRQD